MAYLSIFNVSACCLLAAVCTYAYGRSESNGDRAFCFLFGLMWVTLATLYLLTATILTTLANLDWLMECLDMATNFLLLMACLALHKGKDFTYQNKEFENLLQLAVILILLTACTGFVSNKTDLPTWHIFAASACQMLACLSLVALGFVAGERFPAFATPLRLICAYYALLQIPGNYTFYVQKHADEWYAMAYGVKPPSKLEHKDAEFIDGALGGGKIMFLLCALVINRTLNTVHEKAAALSLFLVNIALSIGLALVKIGFLFKDL